MSNHHHSQLPPSICFRVTRYCNAHCGFCLAPPDGGIHPREDVLLQRLDWLRAHGVRAVNFCGGEPTIHPALPRLIQQVHTAGGKTRLTTNGIKMPDELIRALRACKTQVKLSLHGHQAHHDRLVGRKAFEPATQTLRRLLDANVHTSIQTTVIGNELWVVEWMAKFCLDMKVRRLGILPFIPRGSGLASRCEYELSPTQRRALQASVEAKRRELNGRLELRWLDFSTQTVPVVEPDGTVIIEGSTETFDEVICRIPDATDPL